MLGLPSRFRTGIIRCFKWKEKIRKPDRIVKATASYRSSSWEISGVWAANSVASWERGGADGDRKPLS